MSSELQWHDIHVLLQTVECDSRSLETLGLQAVDDLLGNLDHISLFLRSFERIVKSRHNSMSAISRLPNETLSAIFSTSTLDIYDLLSATAVCSHWRDVALQDINLWGRHVCALPSHTEEMIRRSGETPIAVYPSIREETSEFPPALAKSLDLALAQCHRVSHIELVEVGKHIVRAFSRATANAPILQSMELGDLSYDFDWEDAHTIPPSTFAGHAPNLRHLVLEHIACPQGLLHNVTHLSASRGALGRSCAQILDSLRAMPMLEKLKITEKMFDPPTEVVVGDHIVALPSLRRLILTGNEFFRLGLPQNLSIPSTSCFVLKCTEALRRVPDLLILPHPIPSSPGTDFDSVATTLDRIHIRLRYSSILVEGWNLSTRSVSTLKFTSTDIEPEADMNLTFTPPWGKYDPMLSLLFKTLHLQQVRTIRLSFCSPCDARTLPQSITDLLTMLPALESCVVERIFVGPFAKALNSCVGDGVGMSLTELEELELIDHHFGRDAEARVAESLLAYATARNRMGGRMKVIRLRDCEDMDAMWLEELGRVVGKIECCKTPLTLYD